MKKKTGVLKILVLTTIVVAAMMVLSACGGGKNYSLDMVKLAGRLLSEVNFDCELYQVQEEKVENFIDFEGAETKIMYMGNGSYADSFGIFKTDTEENAVKALETVNSYLADLQDSFFVYRIDFINLIRKRKTGIIPRNACNDCMQPHFFGCFYQWYLIYAGT